MDNVAVNEKKSGCGVLLASQSPRRRELIQRLGREVVCVSVDADEDFCGKTPEETVMVIAARKGVMAEALPEAEGRVIIAADTVVALGDEILGKPKDIEDAARMLRLLSGREHEVFTGVYIKLPSGRSMSFAARTAVRFYDLGEREIWEYIKTGEPMDKAGAYGIQGDGCMLVEGICGDYYNVMGLPIAEIGRKIRVLESLEA